MTKTESKWAARVASWRASGETAPVFCVGKDFKPGGLRYWASRLHKVVEPVQAQEVRLARVVRGPRPLLVEETPITIELGAARLGVRRGFDPEALRAVLALLGGSR
jgi:hypothetical protein